jgi:hypothetical protein
MPKTLHDIGLLDEFPTKFKVGHWFVKDMVYGRGPKEKGHGQRDIFHKSRLMITVVIDHMLSMEVTFVNDYYQQMAYTVNEFLKPLAAGITVTPDEIITSSKWEKISKSRDLAIYRRIP